jgi:hypothetical protein
MCLSEDDRTARIRIAADERAVGDRDIRGAKTTTAPTMWRSEIVTSFDSTTMLWQISFALQDDLT